MSRIWMPGGAGGADVDVVTAGAGDVLKGKVIVGPDGEPLTGTLALRWCCQGRLTITRTPSRNGPGPCPTKGRRRQR